MAGTTMLREVVALSRSVLDEDERSVVFCKMNPPFNNDVEFSPSLYLQCRLDAVPSYKHRVLISAGKGKIRTNTL